MVRVRVGSLAFARSAESMEIKQIYNIWWSISSDFEIHIRIGIQTIKSTQNTKFEHRQDNKSLRTDPDRDNTRIGTPKQTQCHSNHWVHYAKPLKTKIATTKRHWLSKTHGMVKHNRQGPPQLENIAISKRIQIKYLQHWESDSGASTPCGWIFICDQNAYQNHIQLE